MQRNIIKSYKTISIIGAAIILTLAIIIVIKYAKLNYRHLTKVINRMQK
jgi:hypothetical protein